MALLRIQISGYNDGEFPGWVECVLEDAYSEQHLFFEKAPVVISHSLGPDTAYPQPGFIACEVESTWLNEAGQDLVCVNTETPWGVASSAETTQFVVLKTQLVEDEADA